MKRQHIRILFKGFLFVSCGSFVSFFFYELVVVFVHDRQVIDTAKRLLALSTGVLGFVGKLVWDAIVKERQLIKSNTELIEDLQQQVAELKDTTKILPFLQAQLANLLSSRNNQ